MKNKLLENWPSGYYALDSEAKRMEALRAADENGIDVEGNKLRRLLCEKRYHSGQGDGVDVFMRGWIMTLMLEKSKVSKRNKERLKKELLGNAALLCLDDFGEQSFKMQEMLRAEWRSLVALYIKSCYESKEYSTSVFGFVSVKKENIGKLIARDISAVTEVIPKQFDAEELFAPLREEAWSVYRDVVEEE